MWPFCHCYPQPLTPQNNFILVILNLIHVEKYKVFHPVNGFYIWSSSGWVTSTSPLARASNFFVLLVLSTVHWPGWLVLMQEILPIKTGLASIFWSWLVQTMWVLSICQSSEYLFFQGSNPVETIVISFIDSEYP